MSIAVPDGASTFPPWCNSMISADSKYGAAISAKCIISTAPIAKFGARMQLLEVNCLRSRSLSLSLKPGGADHGVHPVGREPVEVLLRRVPHGEVHGYVHRSTVQALGAGADLDGGQDLVPGHLPEVEPGVVGIDRGHQLQVGIGGDRRANRGPHPTAGAEHGDTQAHVRTLSPGCGPQPGQEPVDATVQGTDHRHRARPTEHSLDHRGHVADGHRPKPGHVLLDGHDAARACSSAPRAGPSRLAVSSRPSTSEPVR